MQQTCRRHRVSSPLTHPKLQHTRLSFLPSSAYNLAKHTHTHTHIYIYICNISSHWATSNTISDRYTHTHTHTPRSRRKGKTGWGSRQRDPTHSQNALLECIPIHTHAPTHTGTHPKEEEQRAPWQHVETPVGTSRWEDKSEESARRRKEDAAFKVCAVHKYLGKWCKT